MPGKNPAILISGRVFMDEEIEIAINGFDEKVPEGSTIKPLSEAVLAFKKERVKRVLRMTGGKKSEAATMLGMPKSNFSRLLKQLGMI